MDSVYDEDSHLKGHDEILGVYASVETAMRAHPDKWACASEYNGYFVGELVDGFRKSIQSFEVIS